jgi:tRNA G10  N-methylase Trm11
MLSVVMVSDCEEADAPLFPLIICDPPYGKIIKAKWDIADYWFWFRHCVEHSNPGDNIYDPCCGSGTTARAAIKLGRGYFVVDLEKQPLIDAGLIVGDHGK